MAGALQILEGKRFTYEEFWALKAINFTVNHGESIGVVGENGSGKSTLLKVMANILRPNRGRVKASGKIAPFMRLHHFGESLTHPHLPDFIEKVHSKGILIGGMRRVLCFSRIRKLARIILYQKVRTQRSTGEPSFLQTLL